MEDLRLSVRALRASPVVSAMAVLSLALGIGAVAGWLPARRALRIDPREILRSH